MSTLCQVAEISRLTNEELEAIAAAEAAAAATAPVVIPEGAQVALNRQGYQAFQMVRKCNGRGAKQGFHRMIGVAHPHYRCCQILIWIQQVRSYQ